MEVTGTPDARAEPPGGLRRVIGPKVLALFVLGDILGAGIYARVGGVAGEVGGAIWVSFLVAFVVAGLTAASYAELTAKYPGAGGSALFVNRAYKVPFFSFMVAFAVAVSGLSSASAISRAFGGDYLSEFVALPTLFVAIVFILVMALINFIGVSESVRLNVVLTLIEVGGLLLILVIGGLALSGGEGDLGRPFEFGGDANYVALAVLGGAFVSFYALIGFEDSANMAEETEDPARNFPRALFTGLAVAGVLYLLVGFVAALVVDPQTLSSSSGPLLEVVRAGAPAFPTSLFSAIALVAITNTALINLLMASRMVYGMAREGVVPAVFGRTHRTRRTPWVAIIFTTLIALGLVFTGDLGDLANTTVLLLLVVFVIVNVSVLILRGDSVDYDHFRAPAAIPILGAVMCLLLLTQMQAETFYRAAVLLLMGAGLWLVNFLANRGSNA